MEQRARFVALAKPKALKSVWATIEPPLTWGNQESMRPLLRATLNANASQRIIELAVPKKNFQLDHPDKCNRFGYVYSCGRSSVIGEVGDSTKKASASERVIELSRPKKLTMGYQEDRSSYVLGCGRSSPIWKITDSAKRGSCSARTEALAQPKPTHKDYQPPQEVQWTISTTNRTKILPHVESLSRPKERKEGPYRHPEWRVSKNALNAQATSRVQELAKAKQVYEGYCPIRNEEWRVSRSALKANATERLKELAMPIVRDTMDHVQFDPLAFQVKESALKGRIPSRINDLAIPVVRGPKD